MNGAELPIRLTDDEKLVLTIIADLEREPGYSIAALHAGLDDVATARTIAYLSSWPGERRLGRARVSRAAGALVGRGILRRRRPAGYPFVYELARRDLTDAERGS